MGATGGTRATAGFTLVEMLVAMVLLGIMGISAVNLLRVQHQVHLRQNEGLLATQNARAGLEMMAAEVRNAAFDPYGVSGAAVTRWTSDSLGYTADLNADGDVLDADEAVLYYHDADDQLLVRRTGGVDVTVADGVTAVSFTYFRDASGTPAGTAAQIQQIQMAMAFVTAAGFPGGSLRTQVALRNHIY